jgi:hypothetical protein
MSEFHMFSSRLLPCRESQVVGAQRGQVMQVCASGKNILMLGNSVSTSHLTFNSWILMNPALVISFFVVRSVLFISFVFATCTGGTRFIGAYLARQLIEDGNEVI